MSAGSPSPVRNFLDRVNTHEIDYALSTFPKGSEASSIDAFATELLRHTDEVTASDVKALSKVYSAISVGNKDLRERIFHLCLTRGLITPSSDTERTAKAIEDSLKPHYRMYFTRLLAKLPKEQRTPHQLNQLVTFLKATEDWGVKVRVGYFDHLDFDVKINKIIRIIESAPDSQTKDILNIITAAIYGITDLTYNNYFWDQGWLLTSHKHPIMHFEELFYFNSEKLLKIVIPAFARWVERSSSLCEKEITSRANKMLTPCGIELLSSCESPECQDALIEILADQRDQFITAYQVYKLKLALSDIIKSYTIGFFTAEQQWLILAAAIKLPVSERDSFLTGYVKQISQIRDPAIRDLWLKSFSKMDRAQLDRLVNHILPIISRIENDSDKVLWTDQIIRLGEADQIDFCTGFIKLVGTSEETVPLTLFEFIESLPSSKRTSICKEVSTFLKDFDKEKQYALLAEIKVMDIPEDRSISIYSTATFFLTSVKKKAVCECTIEEIKSCLELLGSMNESSYKIMRIIYDKPADQRVDFCTALAQIVSDFPDALEQELMLKVMLRYPLREWTGLYASIKTLIPPIASSDEKEAAINLLSSLAPLDRTAENMPILLALINSRPLTAEQKSKLLNVASLIKFLAPGDRMPALTHILSVFQSTEGDPLDATASNALNLLFTTEPVFVERTHAYLLSSLETTREPYYAHSLSSQVLRLSRELALHAEHPLYQTAISIQTNSSPEAIRSFKNPYTLFARLRSEESRPIALSPPTQEYHPAAGGAGAGAGAATAPFKGRVAFDGLIAEAEKIRSAATFGDLPSDVGPRTLIDLFAGLDARLAAMTVEQRAATLAYIQAACEVSYDTLKNDILHSTYLQRLLETRGEPADRAPQDVVQLFTILHTILEKPAAAEEGELLSPREEMLLKIATSVRFCPAGKKEGIHLAYYFIKGSSKEATSIDEETIKSQIYKRVYGVMSRLLSEETDLMKELTGTPASGSVAQVSHQALFIKNMIGKRIGLLHDLTFDLYSGVLYDSLVAKTPEEILATFYRHYTPRALIKEIHRELNEELKHCSDAKGTPSLEKANQLYRGLMILVGSDASIFDSEEDWSGDEPTSKISIKEWAVAAILEKLGYITRSEG